MTREWFPHDIGARNDSKILALRRKHGARGVGLYFMLLEVAYEHGGSIFARDDDEIGALEFDLREEGVLDFLQSLVAIGLLEEVSTGLFSSERIREELAVRIAKTEARKAAADKRWSKTDANAMQKHEQSTCNAMPLHNITLHNSNNTKQEGEDRERYRAAPPPPKIPGYENLHADPESLRRFEASYPNVEMRRFYLDAVAEWLPEQKKSAQLRCCIRRVLTWIRRDKYEKRGWFSVRAGPAPPPQPKPPPMNSKGAEVVKSLNLSGLVKGIT